MFFYTSPGIPSLINSTSMAFTSNVYSSKSSAMSTASTFGCFLTYSMVYCLFCMWGISLKMTISSYVFNFSLMASLTKSALFRNSPSLINSLFRLCYCSANFVLTLLLIGCWIFILDNMVV